MFLKLQPSWRSTLLIKRARPSFFLQLYMVCFLNTTQLGLFYVVSLWFPLNFVLGIVENYVSMATPLTSNPESWDARILYSLCLTFCHFLLAFYLRSLGSFFDFAHSLRFNLDISFIASGLGGSYITSRAWRLVCHITYPTLGINKVASGFAFQSYPRPHQCVIKLL